MGPAQNSGPERRRLQVGGRTIAYESAGAGPALILIHGLSGSTRWWRHNLRPLSRHFRVHLVDLIGFGGSRGRGHRFVLGEAAAALAEWMAQIGAPRASVVGHSMGGLIAADLAASFPAQVERLVLVSAAAVPLGRRYVRHAGGLVGALRYTAPSFWPVLAADAARAGPATLLRAISQLLAADISPRLATITAPSLILWGEHDRLVPLALGRQLHGHLPRARFVVIPGAGHVPMWERPAAFNREVLSFLLSEDGASTPGA
jgi:pimeloyl-ACP methyl ester carboxylesterase